MPGGFFCLEVFPIFIKFLGGAVFLYSIMIPDFLEIDLRLRNSVHTMTAWHGSIVGGGGMVGFGQSGKALSRGYGNDLWYTRCIGWGLPSRFGLPRPSARLFYLESYL
jgi:hypothetical protein